MTQTLLLLHGAIGAKSQFERLVPALGDDLAVHTLDFEGHGERPDGGRPFRMNYFVENVLAYLDERNLAEVDLFGHSMGGYVALLTAVQAPQRVRRVFTLGTMFTWSPEIAQKQLRNMDADKIVEKVPRFAEALAARHTALDWRDNMAKSAEMTADLGQNPLLTDDVLAQIEQPVIVSLGDRDRATSLEECAAAARVLPNGALQVFPNTKHPLEQIDVEMLATAVRRFCLG